ncbi:histidine phosphatase family protein [Defluviimonas salinarum]|uniref:Histidine phosphatase family protein n=1 Tax=Defluviimonas salinarum TaxID=2992147 RepID=A0ABT3J7H7_9RHOB|nr:histidine phosphatase family protein [Defluviimonas salinarum]MCW3783628.1 histidine phosphatase family protein [Defluviimonas salinarum]
MAELTLVRHGQASLGAANYDQLTEIGFQQARWIGVYFAESGDRYDRIVCGSLARQGQTAEALDAVVEVVEGLQEYDATDLPNAAGFHAHPASDRHLHFRQLRETLLRWTADALNDAPESWVDFPARIDVALAKLAASERTLAITSGGVIATIVTKALGVESSRMIDLNLQSRNTGVTRLIRLARGLMLNLFNAVPHMASAERAALATYS